jgi:hypothetical protein
MCKVRVVRRVVRVARAVVRSWIAEISEKFFYEAVSRSQVIANCE